MQRVAILHYASPPVIGGVEATIAHQARGLAEFGKAVRLISGNGAPVDPPHPHIDTFIHPLFGSSHPDILHAKQSLDAGKFPPQFSDLVAHLVALLRTALDGCDVCIAHNICTFNKNLPLTVALYVLHQEVPLTLIAWCNDIAFTNPQYQTELHDGWPWELLRQAWPRTRYVTISEPRREELATLIGLSTDQITVITPGIDLARFYGWTPATVKLAMQWRWAEAEGLLLLPSRLTRRKNIELAIRVLYELRRRTQRDYRLIISGPPGPHNPTNLGYLGELCHLCEALQVTEVVHFLYAADGAEAVFIPDDATMSNLYLLADALIFPSVQEGFGIPILEAGIARLPIFCADLPPLRHTARDDAHYFDPLNADPGDIAAAIAAQLAQSPAFSLRQRVRQAYRWEAIIGERLLPLLAGGE
jgi:glycosyltransferase involved in cell wall biosynthesis